MNTARSQLQLTAILANEIVFFSKEEISIYGFYESSGRHIETEFIISRQHLNILLSQNGKDGVELLWEAEQLFVQPHSHHPSINLVDKYGMTKELKAAGINLDSGDFQYEVEEGESPVTELWFVQSVATVPGVRYIINQRD